MLPPSIRRFHPQIRRRGLVELQSPSSDEPHQSAVSCSTDMALFEKQAAARKPQTKNWRKTVGKEVAELCERAADKKKQKTLRRQHVDLMSAPSRGRGNSAPRRRLCSGYLAALFSDRVSCLARPLVSFRPGRCRQEAIRKTRHFASFLTSCSPSPRLADRAANPVAEIDAAQCRRSGYSRRAVNKTWSRILTPPGGRCRAMMRQVT